VFRFDVSEFPRALSVGAELTDGRWRGEAWTARRAFDFNSIAGIYYRRPTIFEFHPDLSPEERRWAGIEARLGFGGVLAAQEAWLNHPHHIGYAEYKPVQLQIASRCGFQVPRTYVGNDPKSARVFVESLDRAVYKPFGGAGVTDIDGARQVFASFVTSEQVDNDNFIQTMHMLQQWIPKSYDVRLTAVDQQCFAVRIDATTDEAHVDWRSDYQALKYSIIEVPDTVISQVQEFMRQLRLRFGAFDFVVRPDGNWVFLECNANGQWAWIEEETGVPIAAALADALEGDRPA